MKHAMSEVETTEAGESPEAPAEEIEATQPVEDVTTWKARLAGKDRALTAAKAEAERVKAEAAALARWKAEREQADLSEVERLNLRIQELEAMSAAAEAKAKALSFRSEFPLAADLLGEAIASFDEGRLAEFEAKLKAKSEPEEPRIDPNQPRRTPATAKTTAEKSRAELLDDLQRMGNPFATPEEVYVPVKLTPR